MSLRFAPWWIACYIAAVEAHDWPWAEWLANNVSIEVCGVA